MESTKYSHTNTPNKHQLERLNLLYETYRRYVDNRPFLAEWWYFFIDRYTRFENLSLDILSEHQLDYIKSEPTLLYYFRSALTKNMKINRAFFDNVYSYKSFLERPINKSIKFSQDEERAKKIQKAIDIARSI